MANAFAAIAVGGLYCAPTAVERVVDSTGAELPLIRGACSQVLDPEINQQLTGAMQQVITGGTGTVANPRTGVEHIGKTGTTDGEQQTWMVGASSRISTAVWVGNVTADASLRSISLNGARADVARHTTFRDHMRIASALYGGKDFPRSSIR